jgi:hypothetical protein
VGVYAFTFGLGLGLTMQTITTAVQNAVEMRDMGTATSSTTFVRQLGSSIGVAIFGAVLSSRLAVHLADKLGSLPAGAPPPSALDANNVQAIQALAEPARSLVLSAFAAAIDDVFRVGLPLVALALVVALFLPEVPLRGGRSLGSRADQDVRVGTTAA